MVRITLFTCPTYHFNKPQKWASLSLMSFGQDIKSLLISWSEPYTYPTHKDMCQNRVILMNIKNQKYTSSEPSPTDLWCEIWAKATRVWAKPASLRNSNGRSIAINHHHFNHE